MSEVLLERPRPHVALIRLNRPEQRNALSLSVRATLAETGPSRPAPTCASWRPGL
jgi:enoyl-CoA hydratase/carnithine racemase